ncbi:2Fe-2S iron-sulfur cluster-binding protein [Streptomyces sp. NPDC047046]|uniref:2Fe-2S iron-sulfur cluster-binding protein n=1 Tax=Streptomyces sp. NPDC047046 TaxID=3155378 RepID=UPI003408A73D
MSEEQDRPTPPQQDPYGEGPGPYGGWEPVPHTDYDADATAFVSLPEGLLDAAPLAAPGHGYVPPRIPPAGTDPGATGQWDVPRQQPEPGPEAPGEPVYGPSPMETTVQFAAFTPEPAAEAARDAQPSEPSASGATGQWQIPVAEGALPEESGEFQGSSLTSQWSSTAPATLPGGAIAPWAVAAQEAREAERDGTATAAEEPAPGGELPGGAGVPEPRRETAPGYAPGEEEHSAEPEAAAAHEGGTEAAQEAEAAEESVPGAAAEETPEPEAEPEPASAAETEAEAAAEPEPEPQAATRVAGFPLPDEHPLASYTLSVNGVERPVEAAWIGESLLYVLRERLGLAGAKDGCAQGECGACNVQVDGRLVASCLVPAATTAGSEVRTVEGLARDGEASDVQRALAAHGAVQCGFCVPGMAMTVHDLLEGNPAPTVLETRQALCGNLCRCSGYRGVLDAVQDVAAGRREASEERAAAKEEAAEAEASAGHPHARVPHQPGPVDQEPATTPPYGTDLGEAGGTYGAGFAVPPEGPYAPEGPYPPEGPYSSEGPYPPEGPYEDPGQHTYGAGEHFAPQDGGQA